MIETTDTKQIIQTEMRRLDSERHEFSREVMKDFDKIQQEKIKELQSKCKKTGHVRGRLWDNNCGWTWYYCKYCDARFDKKTYCI